jgi:hypothetical protein
VASFEKGSRVRAIVPSQSKVQARKRSEGFLFAGLNLVGNDVRPERVPVCCGQLGIAGVCRHVEIVESEPPRIPEQIEDAGLESRRDFTVIHGTVGRSAAAYALCNVPRSEIVEIGQVKTRSIYGDRIRE